VNHLRIPLICALLAASFAATPVNVRADEQALQYVQVTHVKVPTAPGGMPSKPGFNPAQAMAQAFQAQIQDRIHDFLTGVIRGALSRASPILGMLADTVVSKLEKNVMGRVMPPVILKDKTVSSTTTISPQRARVDYEHISIIAQCDAGKVLTLNHDAKTYFVTTLDSSDALIAAAVQQNASQVQVHVDRQRDDQIQTIAGMQAHHEVETFSSPGIPSATTDKWYALSDMTNGCGQSGQIMAGNIEIPLRLERKVDMSTMPIQLPTMPGFDIASLLNTRIETTSVSKIAYDPAFFDAPSGYTQVPPPSLAPPGAPPGNPSPQPSATTAATPHAQS
jgi:hypothetical protein